MKKQLLEKIARITFAVLVATMSGMTFDFGLQRDVDAPLYPADTSVAGEMRVSAWSPEYSSFDPPNEVLAMSLLTIGAFIFSEVNQTKSISTSISRDDYRSNLVIASEQHLAAQVHLKQRKAKSVATRVGRPVRL